MEEELTATDGTNPGTAIDAQQDTHLDDNCSYAAFLGNKFYEYVATIEMVYILSTDENARRELIENLRESGWYHGLVGLGTGQVAAGSNRAAGSLALWEWLGLIEEGSAAEMLQQGRENAELSREHSALAWESIAQAFSDLYTELRRRYADCGLAYAFATTATDGAFLLGELALGAGLTAGAVRVLKKLRFIVKRNVTGDLEVEVQNPAGGSYRSTFTVDELEAKYGKPDDNHEGVLTPDRNWDVDGGDRDERDERDDDREDDENDAEEEGAPVAGPKTDRRTRGRNENTISYDDATGRPISAQGTLREDFGKTTRGDNATAVGRLGGEGYDGGHLVAHRFLGDTPDHGIAPQIANLNRGAWSRMENEWADWTKKGYEVRYNIDVDPPGSVIPDRFDVEYEVIDPKTGRVVHENDPSFKNNDKQEFDRIYFRDMPGR